MLRKFDDIFKAITQDRVAEIGGKIVLNDSEYVQSEKEMNDLIDKIKVILPKDSKELIDDLNELIAYQEGILQQIIYEHGFKDGAALKDILEIAV